MASDWLQPLLDGIDVNPIRRVQPQLAQVALGVQNTIHRNQVIGGLGDFLPVRIS